MGTSLTYTLPFVRMREAPRVWVGTKAGPVAPGALSFTKGGVIVAGGDKWMRLREVEET